MRMNLFLLTHSPVWRVAKLFEVLYVVTRRSVGFIELDEGIFSNKVTGLCKLVRRFAFANERLDEPNQVSDKFNFLNRPSRRMKGFEIKIKIN